MKLACVLLAAGAGSRFGSNKLLYEVDGSPMAERALSLHAALPYDLRALVTRRDYPAVAALGERYGFTVLDNDAPERGMGTSAAIGAAYCLSQQADGALFGVCDQPYLKEESVRLLLAAFLRQPDCVAAAACGERRGNPCVFPRALLPELAELSGEAGGGSVIARHPSLLRLVDGFSKRELSDLDTIPAEEHP